MNDIETPKKDFTPLHGWDDLVMSHSETFGCFLWENEDKQYLEECYPDEEERLEYAQECADSGEYGVAWLVPVPIVRSMSSKLRMAMKSCESRTMQIG